LLSRLREHAQFTRLVGIDIDVRALGDARALLGLDLLRSDDRVQVSLDSFESVDWDMPAIDAAVMLETIEHIDPGRLPRVAHAVFGRLHPDLLLLTTPNREYNPLHGLAANQRRHPGHRFEWTRTQFRSWCSSAARRYGYVVRFEDVGPPDPQRGSSTQMASFRSSDCA